MKDCRYLTGLASATLAIWLTQCASVQELEVSRADVSGPSFEVFARPGDTKTVNDGLATLWQNGDKFNLFHADAGSRTYTADGAFTVDNPETGHAVGSVAALSTAAHDWYLAYPYASSATSPAAVPVTIGASAGTAQVQAGAESMAHLAGPAVPLRGKASRVAADATPSLAVAPAVSVLAIQVTNPGQADVKVTEVRFKAPEAIVGSFTMDMTGESPVFRAVNASAEAVLSVSGGVVLKAGESGFFYLVIKPFTVGAGSQLTLSVNGQERTVHLSRPTTFVAGKMKTLSITLDPTDPPVVSPYYFRRVTAVTPGRKYLFVAEDTKADPVVLRMAKPFPEGTSSGRMDAEDVTEEDGVITLYGTENAFTFIQGENGFSIRQPDGRYLYNHNADNVYVGTDATAEYVWTVTFDEDGLVSVVNRTRMLQYNTTSSVRKYQTRQTSSSSTVGVKPRLYELQNDDEAHAEFLKHTLPGVYAYGTEDWLYADGTHQTAVQTLASNVTFRLYQPASFVAVQIAGIPAGVSTGDRFSVRLTRYVKQALTHSGTFPVVAVKVADGTAWLMSESGTGFIVKIQ
jgi:hypothetical protein